MSETYQERKRRLARERKKRHRERILSEENEYEREVRRRKECLRRRMQRLRASQEQVLERRRKDRERVAERRRNSSQEEREERRRIERERIAQRTTQLSQEEIEERRRIERERIAFKRRNSSRQETEERRRIERERIAERRENETEEAAVLRRQKNAEHMRRLRAGISTTRNASATVSSLDSLSQTTAAKFGEKTGSQLEYQFFENREQKAMTHSVQPSLSVYTQMQVQQPTQPPPVQVVVAKLKPVEKPRPREKQLLAIASHQRDVMSSLASLWKSGKLCDAGISNGSSTVKVHKLVLSAVCPKLLSVSNMDKISHKFLQVNFPGEVSAEALNAFAEYMYNGILDLDHDILEQLKIIAKRLDMKEFEQLCDSHLPNHMHQPASAATAASFTNIPLIQTTMTIPAMTSSLASLGSTVSTSMQSALSINTQVIDIKQEISKAKLVQVKKEPAAVFGQESEVALLPPNKSGNAASFVIRPSIKTELVGPEDDKYGHWYGSNSNQPFTSTTSSSLSSSIAASTSIASVPASSTEFAIPFSEATNVKSTRLKTTLVSDPVSGIVETVCSQLSSMNEDSSKPLDSLPSIDLTMTSNSNNAVYPVRLFSARGDNLPLLTSDAITVNSFIQSEKT